MNTMPLFDPQKLAHYEVENYVAYYQRRWLRLLWFSVGMVREAYGFTLAQALYAAYLVARAEIAFAPFPHNDLPRAEAYMRRFYRFLSRARRRAIDPVQAARLEVGWWVVHREHFAEEDTTALAAALAGLLVAVYAIDRQAAERAAAHRARGMLISDRWVRAGKDPRSPLLAEEEAALCKGYAVIRAAVSGLSTDF